MHYLNFLRQLTESGRVVIESAEAPDLATITKGDSWLADFEHQWRTQLAGEAPSFDIAAASWAGQSFYRACQKLMDHDRNEETDHLGFPEPEFDKTAPRSHYSVDIVFRFLPDLLKFAKAREETDPLLIRISTWCSQWPLSSVSMANLDDAVDVDITGFADDPTLMQLYVDRIVRHVDLTRIDHPKVRAAVHASIGEHPELARRFRIEMTKKQAST